MTLVAITQEEFDVEITLAYATAENIAGAAIYAQAHCFLHPDAARHLGQAVELAKPLGFRLKIFDAFRPREAQDKLWSKFPDPAFVADPRIGSPHARGVAVDLTLIRRDDGTELDMGTGFDDFTPHSRHGAQSITVEQQLNRIKLLGLMTAAGWDWYEDEWWHYHLFDRESYPLLHDRDAPRPMMSAPG